MVMQGRRFLVHLSLLALAVGTNVPASATDATDLPDDSVRSEQSIRRPPYRMSLPQSQDAPAPAPEAEPQKRKGEWVIAPIPGYSPGQGGSLAVIGQYIFKPEGQSEKTQPTTVGVAGLRTEEKSYVLGAGYRGALEDDQWRVQSFAATGKYNFDFYGVGAQAGQKGVHVPLEQSFTAVQVQALRRTESGVYFGPRLTMVQLNLAVGAISGLPIGPYLPQLDRDMSNVAAGFRAQWDTRDDIFYPSQGYYVQSKLDWYRKAFGGDFNLQIFDAEYNQYLSFSNRDVLAMRGYFHKSSDGAPFFMLSSFGGNDLRGYEYGRYRDNVLIAGQVEWRHQLSPRWATTAFTGVGSVAPSSGELIRAEALWSYGAGLRFRIANDNKVNFRLDWARGRDGSSLYFSVGEAF